MSGDALAEVERRLHGRLRAHHLSTPLINRHLEDAVQKGVVEWLRVESNGEEIRDPKAFVVEAAFRRAIDEVRREARRADGATLDRLLELGSRSSSSAEDVAIESLESIQLQAAIDSLPAEQRQVLALHYFGELDQRRAAELLYMSERTFRRRLKETLSSLGNLLGAPAPEQGSLKGLEVGLAAWAGLGGGRLVASSSLDAPLHALLDSVRQAPVRIVDRLRGSATGLFASETPERLGAIAGGPAGKVIGGCAGAAVVCALSGVVGPGLNLGGQSTPTHPTQDRAISSRRPLVSRRIRIVPHLQVAPEDEVEVGSTQGSNSSDSPSSSPTRRGGSSGASRSATARKVHKKAPPTEAKATEEEFSGISRAAAESSSTPTEVAAETDSIQQAAPVEAQARAEPTQSSEPSTGAAQRTPAESEFDFEK
ncbi:MAG: RNA polymerase sigma factor [Solirubrobacterales bacterium]